MNKHNSKRQVLVTGGTGSVGRALVELFCSNGDIVAFQYNTNERAAKRLRESFNAEPIQMDFGASATLPRGDFDVLAAC